MSPQLLSGLALTGCRLTALPGLRNQLVSNRCRGDPVPLCFMHIQQMTLRCRAEFSRLHGQIREQLLSAVIKARCNEISG